MITELANLTQHINPSSKSSCITSFPVHGLRHFDTREMGNKVTRGVMRCHPNNDCLQGVPQKIRLKVT
jgi:hypothetical protein